MRGISQGEVRIGLSVKSEIHDGFDTSWFHVKCANHGVDTPCFSELGDLHGWQVCLLISPLVCLCCFVLIVILLLKEIKMG